MRLYDCENTSNKKPWPSKAREGDGDGLMVVYVIKVFTTLIHNDVSILIHS